MESKLRVFTSFSGYDSQCMALDRLPLEYELVGWSEIDQYAIKAHNAVYPQWAGRNYGDISKIDWAAVPDFDLFTYSSPCQDFSQAGQQKGGEQGSGTRSSLLWECERAIATKKPKYLLMENVAALVSSKFIKLFNKWQYTLVKMGYKNFAAVLNAKHYGVPQNRERVFLVSILDAGAKYEFPKPVKLEKRLKDVLEVDVDERYYLSIKMVDYLYSNGGADGGFKGGTGVQDGNKEAFALTADFYNSPRQANYIKEEPKMILGSLQDHASKQMIEDDTSCPTIGTTDLGLPKGLSATDTANEPFIVASRGREPNVLTPKRTEYGKEVRKQYEAHEISEQRKNIQQLEPRTDGVCNTLTSVQKDNLLAEPQYGNSRLNDMIKDGKLPIRDGQWIDAYNKTTNPDVAGTIVAGVDSKNHYYTMKAEPDTRVVGKLSGGKWDKSLDIMRRVYDSNGVAPTQHCCGGGNMETKICTPKYRIRKLTERECFRLMDVSESDIDKIQAAGISRTQQYKLAGNSIVVAVLVAIFNKLFIDTAITELLLFY